jgi:methionyl-tRNA formyltransferase
MLVACWPYLIDSSIYQCVDKAALNLHPSLLPDHRGPDPLNQQLAMRETKLGVTLHLLNDKFDQGDIVAQAAFELAETEMDLARLQQDCAILGVELFIEATNKFAGEDWQPIPQACV